MVLVIESSGVKIEISSPWWNRYVCQVKNDVKCADIHQLILFKGLINGFSSSYDQIIIFPHQIASPVAIGGCVVGGVYPDHGTLEEIYQVCYIVRIYR